MYKITNETFNPTGTTNGTDQAYMSQLLKSWTMEVMTITFLRPPMHSLYLQTFHLIHSGIHPLQHSHRLVSFPDPQYSACTVTMVWEQDQVTDLKVTLMCAV